MADERPWMSMDVPDFVREAEEAMARGETLGGSYTEVTIKFGKGLVGDPFTSRNGKELVEVSIPNPDKADTRPWETFVISPKMITADIILQYVRAMQNSMGSNVETMYKIVAEKAEALEFRVKSNVPFLGIPLEKLELKRNLLIACINRNGKAIIPRGQDAIEAGDTVIVVTTHTGLNDLKDILR